jgi:hypothetical protein
VNFLDTLLEGIARIPDVGFQTARFVRMDGSLAVVNIGSNSVALPCVGFYPPVPDMVVQLEKRGGQLIVTGPAKQLNPNGVMLSAGTPRADVSVDGVTFTLGMRDDYTPVVGDPVEINWTTGIIQGKVKGADVPAPPPEKPQQQQSVDGLLLTANDSSKFYGPTGAWTGSMPWASPSNTGAWFYPDARQSLAGITFSRPAEIFLPPVQLQGQVQVGVHAHVSRPSGAPVVTGWQNVSGTQGWVSLPDGFAEALRDSGGGIAVRCSNGFNKWRGLQPDAGVAADSLSGALRFNGSR